MAVERTDQGRLILFVDDSDDSRRVRDELDRIGLRLVVLHSSSFSSVVPALKTVYGMIEGYDNIRRYFLPEPDSEGALTGAAFYVGAAVKPPSS